MKWFMIIVLVLLVLCITWCQKSTLPTNDGPNNQLTLPTGKEDEFSKKLQCGSLDIRDDIEQNRWDFAKNYTIDEVFYSPTENSCIWIVSLISENPDVRKIDVRAYNILEKNWFASKTLYGMGHCYPTWWNKDLSKECVADSEKFDENVRQLKWE